MLFAILCDYYLIIIGHRNHTLLFFELTKKYWFIFPGKFTSYQLAVISSTLISRCKVQCDCPQVKGKNDKIPFLLGLNFVLKITIYHLASLLRRLT